MQAETLFQRRLRSEWDLLLALAGQNPGRMTVIRHEAAAFTLQLHGPTAFAARSGLPLCPITMHAVRVEFPVHFPAVPMEMYLETPIFHPNVHPQTGFVCLWDRHRVSNTVEHALHKLVAMLAGDLRNTAALHVMQPAAVQQSARSQAMPLRGVQYDSGPMFSDTAAKGRRRRLQ